MPKNPPKLDRVLTAVSFRYHPAGLNLPFSPSWAGTIEDVLSSYKFTCLGRLDLILRTPTLFPEEISAKLCVFIFERIRTYSEVQGLFTELLYKELKRVVGKDSLCSEPLMALQKALAEQSQKQTFTMFTSDPAAPVKAIVSCCSWWDYGSGAFAALLHLKQGLPLETWEAWVEDCVKFLLVELQLVK